MTKRADNTADAQEASSLSDLDAAFAHAIYDAVIRRWNSLAYLLNQEVKQGFTKLEPRVQAALLCGAAQMLFMDRVPVHAVINHAVEWAKQMVRPGAGGLANAVLRKIALLRGWTGNESAEDDQPAVSLPFNTSYTGRGDELPLSDGRAIALTRNVLPDDSLERLAVATSHPIELLRHWAKTNKPEIVRARALHSLVAPPTILNVGYAGAESRAKLAALDGGHTQPHSITGHLLWTGSHAALVGLLQSCNDVWVQDPSSAAAVKSLAEITPTPKRIIDYCAGQGTKTRQLAYQFPEAEIIATDADRTRYEVLKRTMDGHQVAGHSGRVHVQPIASLRSIGEGGRFAYADLILLDVPCSNTGVLARRPEARYRFSVETQAAVTSVQRQIMADCLPLLAEKGGRSGAILYATCSLEPEENYEQAAWAKKWHKFETQLQRMAEPRGKPGGAPGDYCDGAYSVLLKR